MIQFLVLFLSMAISAIFGGVLAAGLIYIFGTIYGALIASAITILALAWVLLNEF